MHTQLLADAQFWAIVAARYDELVERYPAMPEAQMTRQEVQAEAERAHMALAASRLSPRRPKEEPAHAGF